MKKAHVIVCPFEDVTLQDIHFCLEMGFHTVEDIKRLTRVGMGPCQGRDCMELVIDEIVKYTGKSKKEVTTMKSRPHLVPILLGKVKEAIKDE